MSIETVAVTGGNGRIGEAIIEKLGDRGYRTVNIARGKQREEVSDEYRTTDLLDAGEVYGSLAASDADAIIHMGTLPTPLYHPGYVTYESNVMSTYHILEAATALGLEAVSLASSINALGYSYQDVQTELFYLPVDEAHEPTPRDPYAVSKHALEVTADGFGRMADAPQIASLRYPWVAYEEEVRTAFPESDSLDEIRDSFEETNNYLYTYIHIDDAAAIAVDSIEADFDGHEMFWAVAEDTTVDVPTPDLVSAVYPDVELRHDLGEKDGLIDISKARDLLGWEPQYSWRNV